MSAHRLIHARVVHRSSSLHSEQVHRYFDVSLGIFASTAANCSSYVLTDNTFYETTLTFMFSCTAIGSVIWDCKMSRCMVAHVSWQETWWWRKKNTWMHLCIPGQKSNIYEITGCIILILYLIKIFVVNVNSDQTERPRSWPAVLVIPGM